jgi:hexosaminidase
MKKGLLIALLAPAICVAQNPALIPAPTTIQVSQKAFEWKPEMSVHWPKAFDNAPCKKVLCGIKKTASAKKADISIIPLTKKTGYHSEYYRLQVTPKQIQIFAYTDTGVYRALNTLMQMVPADHYLTKAEKFSIPAVSIEDQPAYNYRGLHLDVCRHFFSVDFIKRYIDAMTLFKFNVFHWHLTEDQGWRIEIKKHPKLTQIGAWRNGSQKGRYAEQRFDSLRYGGFYTQDEIKEVVEYARQRYITVIPEIEMPGHSLAALAAYPHLSCTGGSFQVAKGWGVFDDVYCAGNDSTLTFLKDVLTEVIELFPSKYIHIGGDECPKTRWKTCTLCQNRIKSEGLKDEHELQSWFVQHIEKWLNARGRQIIGWDEILEGGLAPNATVMSWRGTAGGEDAAKQGHNVIMTPGKPCYFDHYQSKDSTEPIAIGGYNPLQAVYDYNPVPSSLNSKMAEHILGAQGNVWTEYMETEAHVEYMVWPRAAALAEALWTGTGRDYKKFLNNLPEAMKWLEVRGINHARHFSKKP